MADMSMDTSEMQRRLGQPSSLEECSLTCHCDGHGSVCTRLPLGLPVMVACLCRLSTAGVLSSVQQLT